MNLSTLRDGPGCQGVVNGYRDVIQVAKLQVLTNFSLKRQITSRMLDHFYSINPLKNFIYFI